jgi:hypothetical protein
VQRWTKPAQPFATAKTQGAAAGLSTGLSHGLAQNLLNVMGPMIGGISQQLRLADCMRKVVDK